MTDDKKEKVIHTRVPEALDDELRRRSQRLGTSVSTLVRNVLSHAFGLVEDVISDSAEVARSARGDAPARLEPAPRADASPPLAEARVLGWQRLVLNLNALCHRCNAILPRGAEAHLALHDRPGAAPLFLCPPCLAELTHAPPRDPTAP